MPYLRKIRSKLGSRGDTIVEVMISMAVLAIVLAATYALSNRAFQSDLNAQYRDQAVSYAQQQLELIKEADNSTPATINTYNNSANPFCIDPQTKAKLSATANPNPCLMAAQYRVAVTFDNVADRFKVTTSWDSASGINQQSVIYYKPNDSFTGIVRACTPAQVAAGSCAPTQTNVPAVGVSTDAPDPVNINTPFNVTWVSTNIRSGSCVASGGPAGSGFPSGPVADNGGPVSVSISSAGSYNLKVTCSDNASNSVPGSATVNVVRPLPIPTTGSAGSVSFNSATLKGNVNPNSVAVTACTFYFDTAAFSSTPAPPAHGTAAACSQSPASLGNGSSSPGPSVSAPANLQPRTNYHFVLCASNAYGTSCGNDSGFTTSIAPAPTVHITADSTNFQSGGSTTLRWTSTNVPSGTCSASGSWSGQVAANSTSGTGALGTGTYTYQITCIGYSGTSPASDSVSITVTAPLPPSCNPPGAGVNRGARTYSGGTSNCDAYRDNVFGFNGGFSASFSSNNNGSQFCHIQFGIKSGSTVTSSSACG